MCIAVTGRPYETNRYSSNYYPACSNGKPRAQCLVVFANDSIMDDKLNGIFVGTWVPSILALGGFLIASQKRGS